MKSDINFKKNPETNQLNVTIKTERLAIQSTTSSYLCDYKKLFTTSENMLKVKDGSPWSEIEIEKDHHQWVAKWNNNDPYSSLAILKNDTDEFIGHIVLDESDQPGIAELAYALDKKFWGQGYGKEAIPIIVQGYAPELVKRDYQLKGERFKRIEATARPDNPASIKLLQEAGLVKFSEKPKWGQLRHFFFLNTADLMQTQSEVVDDRACLTI